MEDPLSEYYNNEGVCYVHDKFSINNIILHFHFCVQFGSLEIILAIQNYLDILVPITRNTVKLQENNNG